MRARGNQDHPNSNTFTQKEQIKTYFVFSHPVGHYFDTTFCSSGCRYQTRGCRNRLFRHLGSYLSCNFLLLQPFSTLFILLLTVWQGTIVHHYLEDNKMWQSYESISPFHVWIHSKCGYRETGGSNAASNTGIYGLDQLQNLFHSSRETHFSDLQMLFH